MVKRGRKQFRRSLKTTDRKLADAGSREFKQTVGNLVLSEDRNHTFEEIAKRWLGTVRHTLKLAAIKRRETCIKNLKSFFVGLAIRNVTRGHCERWLEQRGPAIAPQTFAHELDTMRMTFNYAVEHGLILANPAAHIKRRRIEQAQITVPTRDQFQTLVAAIRHSDGRPDSQAKAKPGADLVELLAYSGMRLREATSLTWRDVDLDRGVITVTGGEEGTKNHESRIIPMTDALRSLLLRLRAERPADASKDDWVVPINDAKTTIRKTCKRLGYPQFTHHDFRHFFATTCIESGVDIPTISRWLGHKDGGALAMRVYGHLREEHSRSQIKRVTFAPVDNLVPVEKERSSS